MKQPPNEQVYAGRVVHDAIQLGIELCKNDITGIQLDKHLEEFIQDHGCVPALKGYKPSFTDRTYEHTICLSRNNEAVHGVPKDIPLCQDDLITIDLVVAFKGWHADSARTFTSSSNTFRKMMVEKIAAIHKHALMAISPHSLIDTYGLCCTRVAEKACGISIIKEFCGHGIGKTVHEDPQITCYPCGSIATFEVGRSYAVEPVVATKSNYMLSYGADGWTVLADCLTAHMEDTIFISDVGVINLTN